MAVQSVTYSVSLKIEKVEESQKQLQDIIVAVHHYLYNFGHNWFYLAVGRAYYLKCSRSWVRVTTHIEKFLHSPRDNYSLLMSVLDHELQKFPANSYYSKQLQLLADFFRKGPNFNCIQK